MLRVAGVVKESITDGPGLRYTIFTQGCNHKCKGCHNPKTWSYDGGYEVDVEDIYNDIAKNPLLKGVTISGGEPFDQAFECWYLISEYIKKKSPNLDVMVYSGYTVEELIEKSVEDIQIRRLLCSIDILVDGEYDESQRSLALNYRGSKNQRVIDMVKTLEDGEIVELEL